VIGIAPPGVTLPNRPEFWRPLILTPENLSDAQRGAQWLGVVARLKRGIDLRAAADAMAIVANRLSRDFPRTNGDRAMSLTPLHDRIVRDVRPALLVLLAAVALVLLIACVNVANLLVARACGRMREVAVRAALGAGRVRLVRQFLAESLVLGVAGGIGGLLFAYWATRALIGLGPDSIPRLAEVTTDERVLAFAIAITVATSVLFGLVPALAATGGAFARFLMSAGRGPVGSAGSGVRKALVVCEMSLAAVLLIAAGLLMRSYQSISAVNPGFSADHLLTFDLALPGSKYATATAVYDCISQYVQRLGDSPGVESAAAAVGVPLEHEFNISSSFTRPGETDSADSPSAGMRVVTPDYFRTLKIPLIAGRLFDARDDQHGAEVVLINQEAARRFWVNQNPVGRQLHLGVNMIEGGRNGQKTIVGVVGDVKYGGLDLGAPPEIYLPYAQQPIDSVTIAARTRAEPLSILPTARAALAALDPELPLARIRTMDQIVGASIAERRYTMLMLGLFAIVAVALASIGVYGVLAYLVTNRTQEIGVRLALGAEGGDVVRLFLREGAVLTAVGLVSGLGGAVAAVRGLRTLLFGVSATDPTTFVAVAVLLIVIALAASYIPARRAARVDPMQALRME
jgi:putative ABC transport system permease protein